MVTDHHPIETIDFNGYRADAKILRARARATMLRRFWAWLQNAAVGLRTVEPKPIVWPQQPSWAAKLNAGGQGLHPALQSLQSSRGARVASRA